MTAPNRLDHLHIRGNFTMPPNPEFDEWMSLSPKPHAFGIAQTKSGIFRRGNPMRADFTFGKYEWTKMEPCYNIAYPYQSNPTYLTMTLSIEL